MITVNDNQDKPRSVEELKALRARAVDTHKAGRHVEAIALYRQFLESVPNDAAIWSNLGVAHRIRQEFDAAVACYLRALELKPNDSGFLSNLGNALKDLDQLDEALAAHSKAASIAPSDYNTRHNYGIALRDAGRFTESLAEFAAASRIDRTIRRKSWMGVPSSRIKLTDR